MPNLVNSGGSGSGNASGAAFMWDPKKHEILDGAYFHGWQFDPASGRLTAQAHSDSDPVVIPDYRSGDGLLVANDDGGFRFTGRENLSDCLQNMDEGETIDFNNTSVYINWLTSQSELNYSWYTDNKSHLILEVA
jgi:hypothetical protein